MCQQEVCTQFRFDYFKMVEIKERADILWSIDDVSSKLKCTTLCLAEGRCDTFGFVEAKGSCQAFSPGLRTAMGKHGFTVYYSKERSASMHRHCGNNMDCYGKGSLCFRGRCICDPEFTYNSSIQACVRKTVRMYQPCVDKDQCRINGSVCLKGKCMCAPGLSYHKAEYACVRKCSAYGNTMSIYEGLAIDDHNRQVESHFTEEKCVNLCTATTAFLCLSVDIKPEDARCTLSVYGYLDVNERYRESAQDGWLLGTRDCAFP